jgi:hypothetical protein
VGKRAPTRQGEIIVCDLALSSLKDAFGDVRENETMSRDQSLDDEKMSSRDDTRAFQMIGPERTSTTIGD